jgi:hypothetical protein
LLDISSWDCQVTPVNLAVPEEAQRCIRAGMVESPGMTHTDSLAALRWMDEVRRQVGVRYPFE